jgi:hypothetical protein
MVGRSYFNPTNNALFLTPEEEEEDSLRELIF